MEKVTTKFHRNLVLTLMAAILLVSVISVTFAQVLGTKVTLKINDQGRDVLTYSENVKDFLKTEGIVLKDGQRVYPSLNTEITEGLEIKITAPGSYHIKDADKASLLESEGETVKEVLENAGIVLGEDDYTKPGLNKKIEHGGTIEIFRTVHKEITVQKEETFDIIEKVNSNLGKDKRVVVQKGVPGVIEERVLNTLVNGDLTTQEVLETKRIKKSVPEIVEVGTKNTEEEKDVKQATATEFDKSKAKKVYTMEATAYDPSAGSKTAMGTKARVGAVAVDPKVIPLGSKLYIETQDGWPSYGYAVAEDTGGAIKGMRIDLFFNSNKTALDFGRRMVTVYVID